MEMLTNIDKADQLKDIGINKLGHRLQIFEAIKELKETLSNNYNSLRSDNYNTNKDDVDIIEDGREVAAVDDFVSS